MSRKKSETLKKKKYQVHHDIKIDMKFLQFQKKYINT